MLKKADANAVAPEALEGARSATGSASGAAEVKRWSTVCKRGVVLRLLRGEPVDAVSREVGVTRSPSLNAGVNRLWRPWRQA